MSTARFSTVVLAALVVSASAAVPALPTGTAAADGGFERIVNGTFANGSVDPWWNANAPTRAEQGRLCVAVPGGTVNPWDALIGQNAVPLEDGQPYTLTFDASADRDARIRATVQLNEAPFPTALVQEADLTATPSRFTAQFTSTLGSTNGQVTFQLGANGDPYTVCFDNISLVGGVVPPGRVPDTGPPVRVNQVGYLAGGPKRATVVTDATEPLPWRLLRADGTVAASGTTTVFGADSASGDHVQLADFSRVRQRGDGYVLEVAGAASHPFAISERVYDGLRDDALAFFYHQRSGIRIDEGLAGEGYGRPAGHVGVAPNTGDTRVPCLPGTCDYALDVRGGWYDAGDHGKYVVNGGISVWQLVNQYERAARFGDPAALGDGRLRVPERGNRVPDVLDEARWELEFLLRMQVPQGQELAGMAHHKIHDEHWTGLPTLPHLDPQQRFLYPPSTAATLNLAASAAQCARVFRHFDRALTNRCLVAADRAWRAALAHPAVFAPPGGEGGGPYDDTTVTDEFYWAAAELLITTGRPEYRNFVMASPHLAGDNFTAGGFSWQWVAPLGDLALATSPRALSGEDRQELRAKVVGAADRYVADMRAQGYAVPYRPEGGGYVWGSNSQVLNNAVVIATAHDLTGVRSYRDAAVESLDYILGRNGLNQSYVTGYGENPSHNQHHRFWANQIDPSLPTPPAGAMAGGPNSFLQDPLAARELVGCPPQQCYVDHIESFSTNEVTINWNAPLAWIAGFATQEGK